jgi:hypothetical protein
LLDAKGTPGITERAWVLPPASQIGPITPDERKGLIGTSVVAGIYDKAVDRDSAFEMLKQRAEAAPGAATETGGMRGRPEGVGKSAPAAEGGGMLGGLGDILFGSTGPRGGRREGVVDAIAKSAARSVGSSIAREITRGVLGSLLGGRRR